MRGSDLVYSLVVVLPCPDHTVLLSRVSCVAVGRSGRRQRVVVSLLVVSHLV